MQWVKESRNLYRSADGQWTITRDQWREAKVYGGKVITEWYVEGQNAGYRESTVREAKETVEKLIRQLAAEERKPEITLSEMKTALEWVKESRHLYRSIDGLWTIEQYTFENDYGQSVTEWEINGPHRYSYSATLCDAMKRVAELVKEGK